ncbi:MAG: hypothetical protein ACO1OT_18735 [Heyndrickxia sp.]
MGKFFITFFVLVTLITGIYLSIGKMTSKPPLPTLTVGEKNIEVLYGTFCWKSLFNFICSDSSAPPNIIDHQGVKPIIVEPSSKLTIKFNIAPNKNTLNVDRWINSTESKSVEINNDAILLPKEKGIYVYGISAGWDKGSSTYAFIIEVR